jgi:integrase-like protein
MRYHCRLDGWTPTMEGMCCTYNARRDSLGMTWKKFLGYENVRVHYLRHTFGRRLRGLGVSLEDRQDLPGHESGRMTTHYSAAEMQNLVNTTNLICSAESRINSRSDFLRITDRR